MQTLGYNSRLISLLSRSSSRRNSRSFSSSSSSSDYSDQSRGGLPRFFSESLPSSKGSVVRVKGDEFWHMTRVLRLGINDRVELFNGRGGLVEGRIEKLDRAGVDVAAMENSRLVSPQATQWHIFAAFSTLKGGRADWLVEKCTAGIGRHCPCFGQSKVQQKKAGRRGGLPNTWASWRGRLCGWPAAGMASRLAGGDGLDGWKMAGNQMEKSVARWRLSLVAVAEATPVLDTLRVSYKESAGIIVVGPEGDLTDEELGSLMGAGVTPVGLGPHRLRVETATIALLSALMLWSDSHSMVNG